MAAAVLVRFGPFPLSVAVAAILVPVSVSATVSVLSAR
jgi:hypothetical protein